MSLRLAFNTREAFVSRGLERVVNDDRYSHFFKNEDGSQLDHEEYADRKSLLEESLNHTYDTMAGKQLEKKSLAQRFVATPLRAIAGLSYVAGAAGFLSMAGPVGFGFTGAGAGASALADVIDSHYYHKAGLIKGLGTGQDFRLAGESAGTKVLGYIPVGTGLFDLYHGRRKFLSAAVDNSLEDEKVTDYAISNFARKLREREDRFRIIPLHAVRDPNYAEAA